MGGDAGQRCCGVVVFSGRGLGGCVWVVGLVGGGRRWAGGSTTSRAVMQPGRNVTTGQPPSARIPTPVPNRPPRSIPPPAMPTVNLTQFSHSDRCATLGPGCCGIGACLSSWGSGVHGGHPLGATVVFTLAQVSPAVLVSGSSAATHTR